MEGRSFNSQAKCNKIYPNDEPLETISIDLEQMVHPKQQKLISKHGHHVKHLYVTCNYKHASRHIILSEILKHCPFIEKIKMKFENFHIVEHKGGLYFAQDTFKCPIKLEKLSSFEFESVIIAALNSNHREAMEFYINMFTEIVKSSKKLTHLGISTIRLVEYLQVMKDEPEVAERLTHLHTLLLHNKENDFNRSFVEEAVLSFLPIVSSSLEVLHLSGIRWSDLSEYPLMTRIRVLTIQWDCRDLYMELSTQNLPNLNTLILCELDKDFPVYLDFEWPFSKPVETIGLHELEWEESIKSLTFEEIKRGDEDEYQMFRLYDVEISVFELQPVNVVLYVNRDCSIEKRAWIDRVFKEINRSSMHVKSLFVDLAGHPVDNADLIRYIIFTCKCHVLRELSYVVIRDSEGEPPTVCKIS